MTITKLENYSSEFKNIKNDTIIDIDNGITKKLLEKYKPKGIYNIETLRNTKDRNRVA